jgi:hypothetical protein
MALTWQVGIQPYYHRPTAAVEASHPGQFSTRTRSGTTRPSIDTTG